jgi:hypothetical protein
MGMGMGMGMGMMRSVVGESVPEVRTDEETT